MRFLNRSNFFSSVLRVSLSLRIRYLSTVDFKLSPIRSSNCSETQKKKKNRKIVIINTKKVRCVVSFPLLHTRFAMWQRVWTAIKLKNLIHYENIVGVVGVIVRHVLGRHAKTFCKQKKREKEEEQHSGEQLLFYISMCFDDSSSYCTFSHF